MSIKKEYCSNISSTHVKGNIGIGLALNYYLSKGYIVLNPLNDIQGYDFAYEDNTGRIKKVQVKYVGYKTKHRNYFRITINNNKVIKQKYKNYEELFIATSNNKLYVINDDIELERIKYRSVLNLSPKYDKYLVN